MLGFLQSIFIGSPDRVWELVFERKPDLNSLRGAVARLTMVSSLPEPKAARVKYHLEELGPWLALLNDLIFDVEREACVESALVVKHLERIEKGIMQILRQPVSSLEGSSCTSSILHSIRRIESVARRSRSKTATLHFRLRS